jgi:hypothetical protein
VAVDPRSVRKVLAHRMPVRTDAAGRPRRKAAVFP